uniref:Transposase (putative) gypsy type domain-containing protein n=1 Tax=Aegilops tauschii subsp. strangulata TaxID=200361 RepID=A0A453QW16_AEGTS
MRLPLHPFFAAVLNHFGLAPGQLSPNGGRAMAGFVALSRSAGVDPSLAVFRHFFALCPFPPHGFYTLRGKDADGLLFARIRAKFVKGWKEDFFFLESSAPWPCPVEWGEPSRSSTFDPSLTVQEKAVADSLLRARGSSPIDLFAYLHHRNMAAANITGVVSSPPPTRKGEPSGIVEFRTIRDACCGLY